MQGLTGLDFPGLVSAIVFTQGCNFHCPYCHNAHLIPLRSKAPLLDTQEVLAFLRKRAGLLDGLVISGGEPTLQAGLADFCRSAKALGYQIKLDSNGSRPELLRALLRENLLDYLALDCKSLPDLYAPGLCAKEDAQAPWQSLRLAQEAGLPHELRTTCVAPFVSAALVDALVPLLGDSPWFLQKARLTATMREKGLVPLSDEALEELRASASAAGARVWIR